MAAPLRAGRSWPTVVFEGRVTRAMGQDKAGQRDQLRGARPTPARSSASHDVGELAGVSKPERVCCVLEHHR